MCNCSKRATHLLRWLGFTRASDGHFYRTTSRGIVRMENGTPMRLTLLALCARVLF